MGRFVKGDVVVVPFPFSDLSNAKRRPAFVVADLKGKDMILCMITSQHHADGYSISLFQADFTTGSLNRDSEVRTHRLFTADTNMVLRKVGRISQHKISEIIDKIVDVIRA